MENQPAGIINSLQHVGIPVTDIIASENFYKRLGFTKVMQSSFTFEGDDGNCIMMRNKAVIIELYQMPLQQMESIRGRKDGHIDHIAFDVDDIDVAFAILKEASFSILEDAPVTLFFWEKGCRYFNVQGPDGERLEFNQIL